MAKSSKKSKEATAPQIIPGAPGTESSISPLTADSARPVVAKKTAVTNSTRRAKSAGESRSVASRKTAARPPRTKTARQSSATEDTAVTDDAIRLRAYFISERRRQNGIAGDSAHDWLEARRQLQEETGQGN